MVHHNKIYGHKFREIRNQKRIPLSFFQRLGVDKSNLSKFERGETMMGIEKLDMMLQEINVSLAEYELAINNFFPDFQEEFIEEIEGADFSENRIRLQQLYIEAYESGYQLLALSAKACCEELSETEKQVVLEYLRQIEQWGYFELSILYFCLDNLATESIFEIMKEFENRGKNHYAIFKYRRRIFQISYRAASLMMVRGEQKRAKMLLDINGSKNRNRDMYISNLKNLAEGFYVYCFENQKSGLNEIESALEIFEKLDSINLKNYYEHRFDRLVNALK